MENQKKNETFLPVFSGFYNTFWEFHFDNIEAEIQEARQGKGLYSDYDIDKLEIDYNQYEADIVENFAEALKDKLSDFIVNIEVQKIIHPKAYNFKNDSVDVKIEYNKKNIKAFIYNHKENFSKYLKSRYTSCDGFISHYSNDFETWEAETSNFLDFSGSGHFLGSILEFISKELEIEEIDFYDTVMENVYHSQYAENIDNVINQSDGSLYEFLTSHGITKNIAEYIENSYINNLISELCLNNNITSLIKNFENMEIIT